MTIQFDKQKLINLGDQYRLKFVVAHGSQVAGHRHKESDLDVAILGFEEIDFQTLLKLHGELGEIFRLPKDADLDLKSLHKVDPLFRYEVVKNSILLYGDATDYEDYKAVSYRIFEDARPLFDLERRLVRKFQQHLNHLHA